MSHRVLISILVLACLQTGCQDSVSTSNEDQGPQQIIATEPSTIHNAITTVTAVHTPTVRSTALPSSTPTGEPVVPDLNATEIGFDVVFADIYPECELPCWMGIEPGQSKADQVQETFEQVFGFENYDVLTEDLALSGAGWIRIIHQWGLPSSETSGVTTNIEISEYIDVVRSIYLYWNGTEFAPYVNPTRVIAELGPPERALVQAEYTQRVGEVSLILEIEYANHMVFRFHYSAFIIDSSDSTMFQFCLQDQTRHDGSLSLGRTATIGDRTFEEVFGMPFDEALQRAIQDDACWISQL